MSLLPIAKRPRCVVVAAQGQKRAIAVATETDVTAAACGSRSSANVGKAAAARVPLATLLGAPFPKKVIFKRQ